MAQNEEMDFEKMMGELAAMKTDLANRKASRSGSRSAAPRDGEQEPRRTRTLRTKTENKGDAHLTVETAVLDSTVSSNSVLSPVSPVTRRTIAGNGLRDPHIRLNSRLRSTQDGTLENDKNEHSDTNMDAALPDPSIPLKQESEDLVPLTNGAAETTGVLPSGLVRRESKRTVPVPLPPKSAQRSRSISHGSGRQSQTTVDENGEQTANGLESSSSTPQEVSTAVFDGPTPRKFLQPFPSSPSLSTSVTNDQMNLATPRIPARSNSRSYAKSPRPVPGSPSLSDKPSQSASPHDQSHIHLHQQQQQQHQQQNQQYLQQQGPQTPVVPPRSRSASRSLSRSNTLNKSDTKQDEYLFMSTSIAEDRETPPSPKETPTLSSTSGQSSQQQQEEALDQPQPSQSHPIQQQQEVDNTQQQTIAASEEALQHGITELSNDSTNLRKAKSNNSLNQEKENSEQQVAHPLAPSLLPADTIPIRQTSSQEGHESHNERPILRKQQSADPAALYRQHQQDLSARDRLPSRHASERRPNRDRNPSGFADTSENVRSREPSKAGEEQERGRKQKSEESSSKGGMFAWVRSRSKSRDPRAKSNHDASHPAPGSTYPEYNPALIPSRSTGASANLRSKSLPRKPSNPNFQADSNGWPPVPHSGMNGDSSIPSLHQRSKSTSKFTQNPPPFSHSTGSNDTSGASPSVSLNISTNKSTIYHENMIRGMGMGSTPLTPTVLLTPQPSFPTTQSPSAAGNMRGLALAMMKDDSSPSSSEQNIQQRHIQLQQAQLQHIQQQQQRLAASVAVNGSPSDASVASNNQQTPMSPTGATPGSNAGAAKSETQRLVATRIYIQTETDFKSVNLAPNSTALDVLYMLQERGCFGQPGDGRYHDRWTIFEYSKEFLIERPLRDFEVVLDVMKTWEADKDNKMICKSFPARNELTAQEVVRLVGPAGQESFVRPHGWVHIEMKKSKWVKRYLHITDTAVYHSKDAKFTGESMLCLLRNFDVYAVQVPRKKAPTKFGFALKSSDKIHLFETPEDDYIHYVCTDSGDSLREWLAGLRAAKGMFMYHANPEMIREGQKHAAELLSSGGQDGLARGNLTEEQVSIAEAKLADWGMLPRSMSVSGNRTR
ncbi:hypothetical protein FBU30_006217 [Linnemannia zychae]|nr:hypothetical protein FBU30_006217 [Linnemannia zychae]